MSKTRLQDLTGCLDDAIKCELSMTGQALLQWGFKSNGFASCSVQMPESVVDQILEWRDQSLTPDRTISTNKKGRSIVNKKEKKIEELKKENRQLEELVKESIDNIYGLRRTPLLERFTEFKKTQQGNIKDRR